MDCEKIWIRCYSQMFKMVFLRISITLRPEIFAGRILRETSSLEFLGICIRDWII